MPLTGRDSPEPKNGVRISSRKNPLAIAAPTMTSQTTMPFNKKYTQEPLLKNIGEINQAPITNNENMSVSQVLSDKFYVYPPFYQLTFDNAPDITYFLR